MTLSTLAITSVQLNIQPMQLELQFPVKGQQYLFGSNVSTEERERAIQDAREEVADLYRHDTFLNGKESGQESLV